MHRAPPARTYRDTEAAGPSDPTSGDCRSRSRVTPPALLVEDPPELSGRLVEVLEARVKRRKSEADHVRGPEIRDDVHLFDERAVDRETLGVPKRDVRAAPRRLSRGAQRHAARREKRLPHAHEEFPLRDGLLPRAAD